MLRLFGSAGLLTILLAALAIATNSPTLQLISLAFGLTMVGLYLWLRRSLPPRSGSTAIPGLTDMVEVFRDDRGVPHLYAKNSLDLYAAQGYVTAQDRLWDMDMNRRAASGTLAEVFGGSMLPLDKHMRTIGLRRAAEASLKTYGPEALAVLEAYAAGVNARIRQRKLSPEFTVLGYRPEPWTPTDTLAILKYEAYQTGATWPADLFRILLIKAVGAEKAADLMSLPPDPEYLAELEEMDLPDVRELLEIAANTTHEASGSSAWAVMGKKSKSGGPLLACHVHSLSKCPAPWYQTHLTGPDGLEASGVTLPGVPGVMLGQNRNFAWGTASMNGDVQSVYVERRHPQRPDLYEFQGRWEQAEVHHEEIRVRRVKSPVRHTVYITRHGPLLAHSATLALAMKWTALEPSREAEVWLAVNRARNWAEFAQALVPYHAPPLNFLFAARDGTVASRAAGAIPRRAISHGQVPLPGWIGDYEWQGLIPFDELPERVNPPEGFVHMEPGSPQSFRNLRLTEVLSRASGLTAERMQGLQTDCVNLHARRMVQVLLHAIQEGLRQGTHLESLSDREKKAMLMISGWEGDEGTGSSAAILWHQWYAFLLEGIFRPQMGLDLYDQFLASGSALHVTDRMLLKISEGEAHHWLGMEGETGLPRIALRAFRRSVALLSAKQGAQAERWRWSREHRVSFPHPLAQRFPLLRPFLNQGPHAVGGSGSTLNVQGYHALRPFETIVSVQWRQVIDMAEASNAHDICVPGQSGHPLSQHYTDQLAAWTKGESFPRVIQHDRIRSLPRFVIYPS